MDEEIPSEASNRYRRKLRIPIPNNKEHAVINHDRETSYKRRLERDDHPSQQAFRMIDLHCHILPLIDDGPTSWELTAEMCRMGCAGRY